MHRHHLRSHSDISASSSSIPESSESSSIHASQSSSILFIVHPTSKSSSPSPSKFAIRSPSHYPPHNASSYIVVILVCLYHRTRDPVPQPNAPCPSYPICYRAPLESEPEERMLPMSATISQLNIPRPSDPNARYARLSFPQPFACAW